jgi:hypothetical protein
MSALALHAHFGTGDPAHSDTTGHGSIPLLGDRAFLTTRQGIHAHVFRPAIPTCKPSAKHVFPVPSASTVVGRRRRPCITNQVYCGYALVGARRAVVPMLHGALVSEADHLRLFGTRLIHKNQLLLHS